MTRTTIYYAPRLLRLWKLGHLHRAWYEQNKEIFGERDFSNAEGQHHLGTHFPEWFVARLFLQKGYRVLPPKYLSDTRPEAKRKATEILGIRAVAYLQRQRKLGGMKLRWPPRPDLLVFRSKRDFFFVEVKRDSDRLSKAQRLFFPKIEQRLGCKVLIAMLKAKKVGADTRVRPYIGLIADAER